MEQIGIPLLDNVLKIFPWHNSKEYIKLQFRYGVELQAILQDLVLLPLLKFDSINDMSQAIGNNKNKYYQLLQDPHINWSLLFQEISFALFLSILKIYQNSTDPSFQSRWRIRIIVDDTLIRRWSSKIARVYNAYNHVDKYYMQAQKMVMLAISVGDGKFVFPLFYQIQLPTSHAQHMTDETQVLNILDALYMEMRQNELSFRGVRFVCDSAYATKDILCTARLFGLEYYGSLVWSWRFELEDGTTILVRDLKHGHIPAPLRQSSYFPLGYYRLRAFHPDLGHVVLLITPYIEYGSNLTRYWVYITSNLSVNSITIRHEHTIRWSIEQMFKTFKHTLGIRFYHSINDCGQQGWFALTCLRFLFVQFSIKLASRFSTLRWGLPAKKFSLTKMIRYIRDHYCLDSKLNRITHLHYVLVT